MGVHAGAGVGAVGVGAAEVGATGAAGCDGSGRGGSNCGAEGGAVVGSADGVGAVRSQAVATITAAGQIHRYRAFTVRDRRPRLTIGIDAHDSPEPARLAWSARSSRLQPVSDSPAAFQYCACYCEENVWQLCGHPRVAGSVRAVLVISNALRQVGIAHQRAAPAPDVPVVWDYHVVLAAHGDAGWSVWDLDSTLGVPVPLSIYLRASFGYPEGFGPPLEAQFRVLEAGRYRETLATDRRHMRDDAGGYAMPPPGWPAIGRGSNLMRFVDMQSPFEGQVVDLSELPAALDRLASDPAGRG